MTTENPEWFTYQCSAGHDTLQLTVNSKDDVKCWRCNEPARLVRVGAKPYVPPPAPPAPPEPTALEDWLCIREALQAAVGAMEDMPQMNAVVEKLRAAQRAVKRINK